MSYYVLTEFLIVTGTYSLMTYDDLSQYIWKKSRKMKTLLLKSAKLPYEAEYVTFSKLEKYEVTLTCPTYKMLLF